jgi:catechol 2,3-dioxygenase
VRSALDAAGLTVHMALDHKVSQGLYITDPDGNLIELYVDAPREAWREDPGLVANSDPLAL